MALYGAKTHLFGKYHGKDTRIDNVMFQKQIVGK